jgi:hypothetical protein
MTSNVFSHSSMIDQPHWKSAYIDWLHGFGFTHAITLSWNRTVAMPRARADLRNLLGRCDRALVGPKFNKTPSEHRTQAVFVFEGTKHDHFHVHSLWRAPDRKWFELGKLFGVERGGVWSDVVPSGSCALASVGQGRNDETIGYILKEQHRFSNDDFMVWASEFHPVR